jgi:sirohydrochlorin cobaltochelatase
LRDGILLFAHGSREAGWAKPFESIARQLAGRFLVELAYLEIMKPTLEEAVASLASKGAQRVRIVPLFLGAGGHVREDLPKLAQAARERHAGIEIVLERTIGERAEVTDAIAAVLRRELVQVAE